MPMKAAILQEAGSLVYGDAPEPSTADPIIDVTLAGINPFDIGYAKKRSDLPVVPGYEGVGRLDGRRVYFQSGLGPNGAMAQKASAKIENIITIPDGVSDEMGVVLGTTGLTAYHSLVDCAALLPGETVLVLGASGVVGRIAVQLARRLGAGRVVAAARNLDAVSDLPVDRTVSLVDATDPEVLAQAFRDAGQPHVVIDPLWGVPGLAALMALARHGRQVQLGHSAGMEVSLAPHFMRSNGSMLLGYSSTSPSATRRAEVYAELCELAMAGVVAVPVSTFPLSQVADAWRAQAASPNRKLCIDVSC